MTQKHDQNKAEIERKNEKEGDTDPFGYALQPNPATITAGEASASEGDGGGINTSQQNDLTELARRISNISIQGSIGTQHAAADINPFIDSESDPELNPNNKKFNVRKWMKSILRITSRDPERYPRRTAGVSFRNLNVHGYGSTADYQTDVANIWLKAFGQLKRLVGFGEKVHIDILRDFEGLVMSGEMLIVLGRPGSGCSTFLKTIAGETHGLYMDKDSDVQYQGISWNQMHNNFRGEVIYQAETETHFSDLTAGDTLYFASRARTPANRLPGVSRDQYALHMRDVVMTMLSLSHTINTKIGNEYIRGVSGGERKRISIAETILIGSPLQCWDNSTRGLDSATALEFVKSLRLSTRYSATTAIVAIYQASQAIYDNFDKTIVLYEGRQIYFGNAAYAKQYFVDMGFHCPDRQTTGDFLTSLTNPEERRVREGFESLVPRTPDEFAARWKQSPTREALLAAIDVYQSQYPLGGEQLDRFHASLNAQKSKSNRSNSPYTLSYWMQIKLCIWRGFRRLRGDMSMTLTSVIGNIMMSLVVSSMFYNLPSDTSSFFSRGSLLFFGILMNGFASSLEVMTLWRQRPIVEKHDKYALYRPSAESISSIIVDIPAKLLSCVVFNLVLYFMTNLRRTPSAFFVFILFSFLTTLTMSNIFHSTAAMSRTLAQAMVPSSLVTLALIMYTGFAVPLRDMVVWFRWVNYINPIAYAFESIMINEFHDRWYPCASFIPMGPGYEQFGNESKICVGTGAVAGQNYISGDAFLNSSYEYYAENLWRNFGIICAILVFFFFVCIIASELVVAKPSKGEVLVYPRGKMPPELTQKHTKKATKDLEAARAASDEKQMIEQNRLEQVASIVKQTSVFHWENVCYDIKIKGKQRRILDQVDGWVKPGTLTVLMGISGAGKTSLLDVLANRVTMGVVTGEMLVDGQLRDDSFQRKTGYVQQNDYLHTETSTVREALIFSALLRQPSTISRADKIAYVEEVIKMLGMNEYADAIVGILGEGLNVEQRKRLSIGVEIAAKPDLLLFFDEPTSGLDSQTAWSICALMRKLADHGQAILCTIHQPSAILMETFDRLLFLADGGKPVYFGELGENMNTLIKYFENKGAPKCPPDANPAEWMLEVTGAVPGSQTDKDWPEIWNSSAERVKVRQELAVMKQELLQMSQLVTAEGYSEFAMPLWYQYLICQQRMFQQYWRSPGYIYAKASLALVTPLFVGFSFYKAETSLQGLQNQLFAVFMFLTMFPMIAQQSMPYFAAMRSLYEVRERPSKAYSWKAFMLSSIMVELPWNTLMAVPAFFAWYYPIGFQRNAGDNVTERSGTMFLLIWIFLVYGSTLSSMVIAGIDLAETAGNVLQFLFSMTLIFCGVLATSDTMPRFWIFMYRISPFTYFVSSVLSTGVAGADVQCSSIEVLKVHPPQGRTCLQYFQPFMSLAGGRLINPDSTDVCEFCPTATTDEYLARINIHFNDRWRNIGILFVYIAANVAGAVLFYWLVRVPKKGQKKEKKE
ncbi:ABC transporter CDR4 [Paracoccidioides lutzii Pb01]|uniref:ABC transporter CDR4 n=1 Tax=Paracoccidioides lutzii (strain ATCC MYA-826 / Pb01) TaxID=502779 RepID=C1GSZ4_PARBA|nr:ABC transporter CDR4 [Paracoccidioides lutzii Pb01]EEH39177.2 ABC transporter CDR4 [Paracoccidioides lutzii Pb01]